MQAIFNQPNGQHLLTHLVINGTIHCEKKLQVKKIWLCLQGSGEHRQKGNQKVNTLAYVWMNSLGLYNFS